MSLLATMLLAAPTPAPAARVMVWNCAIATGDEKLAVQIRTQSVIADIARRKWIPGRGTYSSTFTKAGRVVEKSGEFIPIQMDSMVPKGSPAALTPKMAMLSVGTDGTLIVRDMDLPEGASQEGPGLGITYAAISNFETPSLGTCALAKAQPAASDQKTTDSQGKMVP